MRGQIRTWCRSHTIQLQTVYREAVWRVWLLSVAWVLMLGGPAAAFDTACGKVSPAFFADDVGYPAVVEVSAVGQATGTYKDNTAPGATRRLVSGQFALSGRGFVVGQFVVTAAHVVYPSKVEYRIDQHVTSTSVVVSVDQTTIYVGGTADTGGMPAEIVHLSHRFDLAILRPEVPLLLQSFPYPPAVSWWSEFPGQASSLLRTGDCVIALAAERDANDAILPGFEARAGHVIAPHAVSSEPSVVAGLNPDTVTISTRLIPGDSGSPVIAFDGGTPRLVGVVTATRHPFEPVSYISRLDPILPILEALHAPVQPDTRLAQAR
jgi:hypothetical protein